MVFHPLAQTGQVRPFVLHVRTTGPPGALVPSLQRAVRETDPGLVVVSLRTIEEQMTADVRQERMFAALSTFFASLGLCLSCVGLYGVAADGVERRTREIGIHATLGASRRRIAMLVLRETLATVGVGLAIGSLAARIGAPLLRGLVYGLEPTDLGSMAAAAAALASAALAAAVVPALRASRIDPAAALRCE